jgi:hypothetical protein
MEWLKNQEVEDVPQVSSNCVTLIWQCEGYKHSQGVLDMIYLEIPHALYGKGEFSEYIPYKIISFLKGEIEVKPASNQYADYFFNFLTFSHVGLNSNFYTTLGRFPLTKRDERSDKKNNNIFR